MNDDLRDKFAIAALPAILADALALDEEERDGEDMLRTVAKASYQVADAMLKARKEPSNG